MIPTLISQLNKLKKGIKLISSHSITEALHNNYYNTKVWKYKN